MSQLFGIGDRPTMSNRTLKHLINDTNDSYGNSLWYIIVSHLIG